MSETWITTVRVPRALGDEIEMIARTEGVSVAEIIRTALLEVVQQRRKDGAFQKRLQDRLDADAVVLDRLKADQS